MRRFSRGLMANVALEAAPVAVVVPSEGGTELAEEGWKGALMGLFFGGYAGAAYSNKVERKKAEIEAISKELEKAALDAGRKAVKDGKISSEDFKKNVEVGWKGVLKGFLYGSFLGPIYTYIKEDELEELKEELTQRCKELDTLLQKEQARHGKKSANESIEGTELATEGWKGAVGGALAGLFGFGTLTGAVLNNQVIQKKAEVEHLAKEIAKVAQDEGKRAVKEGKISAEDFKKNIDVGFDGVIGGFFGGGFFGPFYTAIRGHELEELHKEMETQMRELNRILEKAQKDSKGKTANESEEIDAIVPVEQVQDAQIDTEVVAGGEPETPQPAAADMVECDLLEIAEGEAQAERDEDDTDTAADAIVSLEAIAETLRASLPAGGLSRDGASAIHIALGSIYRQVGLGAPVMRAMPSLESYGGTSGRAVATQLALETVMETVKKIWAAIVEALKKSIAWLQQRFQLMFGAATKLQARAQSLNKAVMAAADQGEPRSSEIDNARLVRALHIGGSLDHIGEGAERIIKAAEGVYKPALARVEVLQKILESGSVKEAQLLIDSLAPEPGTINYHVVSSPEGEGLPAVPEGKVLSRSDEMLGGKAIVVVYPNPHESTNPADAIHGASVSVMDGWPKVEVSEQLKLKTLTPQDAEKLTNVAARLAAAIGEFQQGVKHIADAKQKALAKAEEFSRAEGDDEQAQARRELGKLVMASGKLIDNPVAGFTAYALNSCKALLDYVAASVSLYGVSLTEQVKEGAQEVADKTKEAAGKAGDAIKEGAAKAGEKISNAAQAVKDKVAGEPKAA